MAAESEWRCPICCNNQEDVAYMLPCLHQFCTGCAARQAQQNPCCPLCKSATTTIKFSVWSENDYLTFDVPGPTESVAEDHQDEQGAAEPLPRAQVGGFPPEVWADFFRSQRNNIRPLLPWMQWQLLGLFEGQWWEAGTAEGLIVSHLCCWGLDEAVLVRNMQNCLGENAPAFVGQLFDAAVRLCAVKIRRYVGQQDPHAATARGEHEGPTSSPSPTTSHGGSPGSSPASSTSPESSDGEEQAGTSEAALHGGPRHPPSTPVPAEQEQAQEEPGQAAVAGPSAQDCSHSPSAPSHGRYHSTGESWRPPKRRAPRPQDSPQPCKRPPRRQH